MEPQRGLQCNLGRDVAGAQRSGVLVLRLIERVDVRLVVLRVVELTSFISPLLFSSLLFCSRGPGANLHDLPGNCRLECRVVVRQVRQLVPHGRRRRGCEATAGEEGTQDGAEAGERHGVGELD